MSESEQLPPKPEVALALLQTAPSVYVHLDPRRDEVKVPSWLKKQPQLVLQIGLNMTVNIPDLDVGDEALSCTLSFNRSPHFCYLPWPAIYGLVGEDGRGMIWPDSVPAEVTGLFEGRAAGPKKDPTPAKRRGHLRVAGEDDAGAESSHTEGAAAAGPDAAAAPEEADAPSLAGDDAAGDTPSDDPDASEGKRKLPPYLRVVK